MSKSTQDKVAEFGYPQVLEGVSLDDPWSMRMVHQYSWQWDIVFEYDSGTELHNHRIEDLHLRIICDSSSGEYIPMFPTVNCMRKPSPEPVEDVHPPDEQARFETQRDVLVWLRSPRSCGGMNVLDYLADWIERHHFEGLKDNVRGVGAVTAQNLYEQYGTMDAFINQDEDVILDKHPRFDNGGTKRMDQLFDRWEPPEEDDED